MNDHSSAFSYRRAMCIGILGMLAAFLGSCGDQLMPGGEDQALQRPRFLSLRIVSASSSVDVEFRWVPPVDSSGITGYTVCSRQMPDGEYHCVHVDASNRSTQIS